MDLQIAGKIAIIGGGSKGLGLACAKALAAEGCNVVLIARNQETLEKARSEITSEFKVDCSVISADLSSLGGIIKCTEILANKFSEASILINNVGGPKPVDALGAGSDDWQTIFSTINFLCPNLRSFSINFTLPLEFVATITKSLLFFTSDSELYHINL